MKDHPTMDEQVGPVSAVRIDLTLENDERVAYDLIKRYADDYLTANCSLAIGRSLVGIIACYCIWRSGTSALSWDAFVIWGCVLVIYIGSTVSEVRSAHDNTRSALCQFKERRSSRRKHPTYEP